MDSQSARYVPMNRFHILGFSNRIPQIDWKTYLPRFKDQKGDDVAFHLVKFHVHIRMLGVEFHEDCLMKMFMDTLEEKAQSWYEGFPFASLYSLDYFYAAFCKNYKEIYPSLMLVENFYANHENLLQHMGINIHEEDLMDDEIKEALFEISNRREELVEISCCNT
jgi:hypothetical protein